MTRAAPAALVAALSAILGHRIRSATVGHLDAPCPHACSNAVRMAIAVVGSPAKSGSRHGHASTARAARVGLDDLERRGFKEHSGEKLPQGKQAV